jgi:hypothetical protein
MSGILDFKYTGNDAVDSILKAVADAAAGYHNANLWNEEGSGNNGESYIDLIQIAADKAAQPQWQPIETAPKDVIILATDGVKFKTCDSDSARFFEAFEGDFACQLSFNPTHWMPLPKPPQK